MLCLARKSSAEDKLWTGSDSLKRLVNLAAKHNFPQPPKNLGSLQTMKCFLLLQKGTQISSLEPRQLSQSVWGGEKPLTRRKVFVKLRRWAQRKLKTP